METGAGNRKSDLQNDAEIITGIWLFIQHIWTDRAFQGRWGVSFGRCLWLLNVGCQCSVRGLKLSNSSSRVTKPFCPFDTKCQSTEAGAKGASWDDWDGERM